MNCEQVEELLSPYLDNVLATEEQSTISMHLEICSECTAILADFRRFDTLLSQMPRISPNASLRERIFSSPDYLQLMKGSTRPTRLSKQTVPYKSVRTGTASRGQQPYLVALPGGRNSSSKVPDDRFVVPNRTKGNRRSGERHWGRHVVRTVLVAAVLLVLVVGGLISLTLWQRQTQIASNTTTIMPPAGLQQGPIPAGIRFLFLRNGALWSASANGNASILRLTSVHTTVAAQWVVKPAQAGRNAGNMVAYVDLQQGFVHIVRSDGQNDTTIRQPLLKHGVQPATVWNTATGAAILSSLSWSNDGKMLAFVADPTGTAQTQLTLYNVGSNKVQTVALPISGTISHLTWSPDNVRIGFVVNHNGNDTVLDYNTLDRGVLTLQSEGNVQTNVADTVLSLQWSPDIDVPALTWSTGQPGNVHNIWVKRVGIGGNALPTKLASGNYAQAAYSATSHNGIGSWLLVKDTAGVAGDIVSVDLSATVANLTTGKQVHSAQWSPDGTSLAYLTPLSHGMGMLYVVNVLTGTDTLISSGVAAQPFPAWSADSQHLAYSIGSHVQVVNIHTPEALQTLKPQGSVVAFSWSLASPTQLVLSTKDGQQGLYLVDSQNGMVHQFDKEGLQGSIYWTQIP